MLSDLCNRTANMYCYSFLLSLKFILLFFAQTQSVRVSFIVSCKGNIGSDMVCVEGNHAYLGAWNGSGTPLFKANEGSWLRIFQFPKGENITFHITRGRSGTDAIDSNGETLEFSFAARRDTVIDLHIYRWLDIHGGSKNTTSIVSPSSSGGGDNAYSHPEPAAPVFSKYHYHNDLPSGGGLQRRVTVTLPDSYTTNSEAHYPVLYVHDGLQGFYGSSTIASYRWRIAERVDSLIKAQRLQDIIVVSIDNGMDAGFTSFSRNCNASYRNFVANTLKPFIDQHYRTQPEAENTVSMGADVGALTAFLLSWEQPQAFGKAICLSPRFDWEKEYYTYLKKVADDAGAYKNLSFYFDNGTNSDYELRLQQSIEKMTALLEQKGYSVQLFVDEGAMYGGKKDWSRRIWSPLLAFFGN